MKGIPRHRLLVGALAALLCTAAAVPIASLSGNSQPSAHVAKPPPQRTSLADAKFRFRSPATAGRRSPGATIASAPPDPVTGAVEPGARTLVFDDEFEGKRVDRARWSVYDSPGHAGFGLRRPSAMAVRDGKLVITAKDSGGTVVSGGMSSKYAFKYGRVEFRVRTEPDPTGTMSGVVLTWPAKQWSPEFTEIDGYETGPRANNTSHFDSFVHFGTQNRQKWITYDADPSRWHAIALEWYPDVLEVYVDGVRSWSVTDPVAIPDVVHHACIQLDARNAGVLTKPVRMFVDYIRVYR